MPLNHTSQYAELTDDQCLAIGKYVVEWANIEFLLGVLLSRLLATPEFLARTYTDSMSAVRLQEAINEAVEIHQVRYGLRLISAGLLDKVIEINRKVGSLRASRNKIAHFCWSRSSDDAIFGTSFAGGVPSPKSVRRNSTVLKLSDLAKLHREALSIVEQLNALIAVLPSVEEDALLSQRESTPR